MNWNILVIPVILGLSTLLTLGLTWLAVKYSSFIKDKIKNSKIEGIMLRLGDASFKVVRELQQTVVAAAKADGTWNAEKAAEVKKAAIEKLKSYIGPEGIKEALVILGLDNTGLDKLIGTLIESEVFTLKEEIGVTASAA